MEKLTEMTQWKELYENSGENPVVILKHSMTCGVSGAAYEKMAEAEENGFPFHVYLVVVQESRDISNQIAEDLSLTHQSPQVIVVKDREVLYDADHFAIEPEEIRRQLTS